MANFSIEKKAEGNTITLSFLGSIDEDASFAGIETAGADTIVLDLNQVGAINSCGIREWINWIKEVPSSAKIVFRSCPKVIIDQINMVSGFLPERAEVESFYVPYYSDASGEEKMVLFSKGKEFQDGKINPPEKVADESGEEMEMDVIEAKYFKFLNR